MAQATAASPSPEERIDAVLRSQAGRADALIEVLHRVQAIAGHLPPASLHRVATGLQLPLSRVQGVASFYHLFRLEPPPPHCCAVCLGTACFVRGALPLVRQLEQRLGQRLDGPAGPAGWAIEAVSCVGACGLGPLLLLDGVLLPRLPLHDPAALECRLVRAGLPAAAEGPP